MSIKPVAENDVDMLFDEIERIRELYIKFVSNDEPTSERWLRSAISQNLPAKVVQDLVVDLKTADSIEDMYNIINTCTFDHRSGLPKGQANTMLHLTEGRPEDSQQDKQDKPEEDNIAKDAPKTEQADDKAR